MHISNTEDKAAIRLVAYGLALVAIASREKVLSETANDVNFRYEMEARAIADSIIAEGDRLFEKPERK